ncbi:MAG: glycosyltransferase [Candidatus Thorarchaeota archaeon]|jgi:hypothetical protein
MKDHNVRVPYSAADFSSRLTLSLKSASSMMALGVAALGRCCPLHLDGIDVFIHPFIRRSRFLHDYHVPLVPELKWLGLHSLAAIAHALLPDSLRRAKVIISPNMQMLKHAANYAKIDEFYIIPNYPPQSFYSDTSCEKARAALDIPDDRPIAVFVGGTRLREIYGIDLLLRTWLAVKRKKSDALLYVLGPSSALNYSGPLVMNLKRKGIIFTGPVKHSSIPTWIAATDLCLSQRTPGFPMRFYNIHDSIKLSEYALFEKPIVAAGYLPGEDYIHAETNVDSYSSAILSGFAGEAPKPTPHTWEENLPNIRKAYAALMDG